MNSKTIFIKSIDNTDILIFVDKIQYIRQTNKGVEIGLRDNVKITSGATFNDVFEAAERLFIDEKEGVIGNARNIF
jgi:hypothetical protein